MQHWIGHPAVTRSNHPFLRKVRVGRLHELPRTTIINSRQCQQDFATATVIEISIPKYLLKVFLWQDLATDIDPTLPSKITFQQVLPTMEEQVIMQCLREWNTTENQTITLRLPYVARVLLNQLRCQAAL